MLLLVLMLFLGCPLCNNLMGSLRTHMELLLKSKSRLKMLLWHSLHLRIMLGRRPHIAKDRFSSLTQFDQTRSTDSYVFAFR